MYILLFIAVITVSLVFLVRNKLAKNNKHKNNKKKEQKSNKKDILIRASLPGLVSGYRVYRCKKSILVSDFLSILGDLSELSIAETELCSRLQKGAFLKNTERRIIFFSGEEDEIRISCLRYVFKKSCWENVPVTVIQKGYFFFSPKSLLQ